MNLDHLATGITHDVTLEMISRLSPDLLRDPMDPQPQPGVINPHATATVDHIADRLTIRLKGHLLAERLPPQNVHHVWNGEHEFTLTTTVPRHATWWDMFKDTYRTRWWLRALVRRRPVRYVDQPVSQRQTRRCAHNVTVEVGAAWTYPQAPTALRGGLHLGPAVLKTWHDGGTATFATDVD